MSRRSAAAAADAQEPLYKLPACSANCPADIIDCPSVLLMGSPALGLIISGSRDRRHLFRQRHICSGPRPQLMPGCGSAEAASIPAAAGSAPSACGRFPEYRCCQNRQVTVFLCRQYSSFNSYRSVIVSIRTRPPRAAPILTVSAYRDTASSKASRPKGQQLSGGAQIQRHIGASLPGTGPGAG